MRKDEYYGTRACCGGGSWYFGYCGAVFGYPGHRIIGRNASIVATENTDTYPETETLTVTVDTTDPSFSLSTITPYGIPGAPAGRSYGFTATVTDTNLGGVNKGVMRIIASADDCDAAIDFTETTRREYAYNVERTISYFFTPGDNRSFCFRATDAAGNASFLEKDIPAVDQS